MFDVLIVGGGAAGLQAAMTLGRARRRVLLAAAGPTRNAPAAHSHNLFTRDGAPPAELQRLGRADLVTYKTVEVVDLRVESVVAIEAGFSATLAGGRTVQARKLLLATGMRDVLPPIPGLAEAWGKHAFACPYCHGFEVADKRFAVLARGPEVMHYIPLLLGWSPHLTLLTDGPAGLADAELDAIRRAGVAIHEAPVVEVVADAAALRAVKLADGTEVAADALFFRPPFTQASDLGEKLGAAFTEHGHFQAADMFGQTTVPGCYAAGDSAQMMAALTTAIYSGALAAGGINHALAGEDFAARTGAL